MIRVRIEIEHYDGSIEIERDDSVTTVGDSPRDTLKALVAAVEASALAAMSAEAEPR